MEDQLSESPQGRTNRQTNIQHDTYELLQILHIKTDALEPHQKLLKQLLFSGTEKENRRHTYFTNTHKRSHSKAHTNVHMYCLAHKHVIIKLRTSSVSASLLFDRRLPVERMGYKKSMHTLVCETPRTYAKSVFKYAAFLYRQIQTFTPEINVKYMSPTLVCARA